MSDLLHVGFVEEPDLAFANGEHSPDPKAGIAAYGPRSRNDKGRHPETITLGFIGTAEHVDAARKWILNAAEGIPGTPDDQGFPGMAADRGFFSKIVADDEWIETLSRKELDAITKNRLKSDRFDDSVALIEGKLKLFAERDQKPTCVILALPDDPIMKTPSVAFQIKGGALRTRNLRCAIKARAMVLDIPTQILLQKTIDQKRDPDHPAKKAWNFFTALYFKAGGIPWGPAGLPTGSCYIGISFFRPFGHAPTVQTSVVQAFDENGESLILRGPNFSWNERTQGKSPHLSRDAAETLVRDVLASYKNVTHRTPKRVVIHKTSTFHDEERAGFQAAITDIERHDFVALSKEKGAMLFREGERPALRGTKFSIGANDYLFTVGYIDCLKIYPAMHVPIPLRITDHVGYDTPRDELLREILTLTKMNWNSARLGGNFPITLRFAQAVAEVLRELGDTPPRPQFKFYR